MKLSWFLMEEESMVHFSVQIVIVVGLGWVGMSSIIYFFIELKTSANLEKTYLFKMILFLKVHLDFQILQNARVFLYLLKDVILFPNIFFF